MPAAEPEPAQVPSSLVETASVRPSDPAADLMERLGTTIDEWATTHRLQALPRDVVIEQAVVALQALLRIARSGQPR